MENFNIVPDKGTFGGSVEVVNQNFLLAQQEMEVLQNKCENESARAIEAENSLRQLYNNLQQSQPIPVTSLPATGEAGKIYRLAGTNRYADYMWDGTQFIKMAEYDNAIDDKPTPESNNLVRSGGVYPIVDAISEEVRMPPLSINNGKWYDANGEHNLASFMYQKYAVEGGKEYKISSSFRSNSDIHFLVWLDEQNNFISYAPYMGSNVAVVIDREKAIAPLNAAYACLNSTSLSPSIYPCMYETGSEIRSNLLSDEIRRLKPCNNLEASLTTDNSFINLVGQIVSNSSYLIRTYSVVENQYYIYTGSFSNNIYGVSHINWYDANDNYIMGSLYSAEGDTESKHPYNKLIKAPEGAVTAKINIQKNNGHAIYSSFREVSDSFLSIVCSRNVLDSCALGSVRATGIWLLIDSNTYTDKPYDSIAIGFLKVTAFETVILQEFLTWDNRYYKRQFFNNAEAGNWILMSPSSNTFIESTRDTTDRTAEILAMLQSTGTCRLGEGVFWIDSLVMPDNTSIIGSGTATKVFLKDGDNKFAIRMGKYCIVENLSLFGSTNAISVTETVGTRHGIHWYGNYSQQQDGSYQPMFGTISNVYISRFNGGGITCYNTGYGTRNFIAATNVHIENCGAGINISYWSEFHKFTNIRCYNCYYGCINNGGNNVFVNCDFSANLGIAFLMDNAQNQSPNNSHGSVIGCVFNHTANNTGVGIKILNCNNGFIFEGCQIFFSKIQIEDSAGIEVVSTNFGQSNCDIIIKNGGVILFANNIHQDTPPSISITNNNKVHFVNCYNRTTGNLISA